MRQKVTLRACAAVSALIVGATLVTTACDSRSVVTGSNQDCPATPGVTPTDVTYGLLYPTTGVDTSTFTPYRAGIDARLGLANDQGGIYGRRIQYTWADDGATAQNNLVQAQHLVNYNKVFGVQEFSSSPQGSAPWLNREGIPVVGTSDDAVWAQYNNMFSYFNLITPHGGSITTWGDYAKSQHTKKVAVLIAQLSPESEAFGTEMAASMRAVGIQVQIINFDAVNLDTPELVARIRDSGADMITGVFDATKFVLTTLAVRAAIPTIKILSASGYDLGILAVGKNLAGMGVFTAFLPFETPVPAQKIFINAMTKYSPQQLQPANEIALVGWIETDLLLRGLQAAGRCPTRQSFITNLRNVTNYSAGGLLATSVDMKSLFGKLTVCYSFLQISHDGKKFVPVGPKSLCGSSVQ
ncbi:MAG: ABC transporter substrate-binding protein [Frankia sp.]